MILSLWSMSARAEATQLLPELSALDEYAMENGLGTTATELKDRFTQGGEAGISALLNLMRAELAAPIREAIAAFTSLLPGILLLSLIACIAPGEKSGGAVFIIQLSISLRLMRLCAGVISGCGAYLGSLSGLADILSPVLAAALTLCGRTGSAAMISPAAAIAGNIVEKLMLRGGLPACRFALALAACGNLCDGLDLGRSYELVKKALIWGAGLLLTLFAALTALQGGMSGAIDNVAVRTAKYAVDSATPVIGSGISEAWESYMAGLLATKSALGISGIAIVLLTSLKPMLRALCAMLALEFTAVILNLSGAARSARAAEQSAGVCRMCLMLECGAMTVWVVLIGATIAAGGTLLG